MCIRDRAEEFFRILSELRTELTRERFQQVLEAQRSNAEAYRLIGLEADDGQLVAVAGFRILHSLSPRGKHVYVDDLVTTASSRSRGYGHLLLSHIEEIGRKAGCVACDLDSSVQRFEAHRFYLRERYDIRSFHFRKML